MDDTDRKIVRGLQRNARLSDEELAKELRLTPGMVRQRLGKLLKRRWLQIAAVADPYEMGYDTPALIGLSFEPKAVEKAVQDLMETPEVSYMVMTTGDFDVMVEVMCRDRDHLNQLLFSLERMPGLTRTQVHLILRSYKTTHVPPEDEAAAGQGRSRS